MLHILPHPAEQRGLHRDATYPYLLGRDLWYLSLLEWAVGGNGEGNMALHYALTSFLFRNPEVRSLWCSKALRVPLIRVHRVSPQHSDITSSFRAGHEIIDWSHCGNAISMNKVIVVMVHPHCNSHLPLDYYGLANQGSSRRHFLKTPMLMVFLSLSDRNLRQ